MHALNRHSPRSSPGTFLFAAYAMVTLTACAPQLSRAPSVANYEIWATDQGTNVVHIFDSSLRETGRIDLGTKGVRVPHLIEFTPDNRYAFVAALATGNVAVIRTSDREIVKTIATGPRTHHAAVSPDGRKVLASVIGTMDSPWDGKVVEIDVDASAETFSVGRQLVVADDPLFASRRSEFKDTGGPVCAAYTADGAHAYVAFGPGLAEGGAIVLDTREFKLARVFPPGQVQANCGTMLSPDGTQMHLVGGDRTIGVWNAIDTRTHEPAHQAQSGGHDAHGSRFTPDGREYWVVNRVTSNAQIIDPRTRAVIAEIAFAGKTPDIIAFSPDSRFAFITLRGPNPVTMPHLAVGETPGVAVFDVKTRKLVTMLEPSKGDPKSDFHGIAVRTLR